MNKLAIANRSRSTLYRRQERHFTLIKAPRSNCQVKFVFRKNSVLAERLRDAPSLRVVENSVKLLKIIQNYTVE